MLYGISILGMLAITCLHTSYSLTNLAPMVYDYLHSVQLKMLSRIMSGIWPESLYQATVNCLTTRIYPVFFQVSQHGIMLCLTMGEIQAGRLSCQLAYLDFLIQKF